MKKTPSHPDLIKPKWNEIIWRYFSLEKFLDLIMNERLYFTRISNLTDGYEGIPLTNKPIRAITTDSAEIDRANQWHQQIENIKNTSFVNCWSLGIHESFALWKIYLGGSGAGVAIRSNFKSLSDSLYLSNSSNLEIFASKVKYANYTSTDNPSDHEVIITKRPFYEFENELRLFFSCTH